MSIEKRLQQQRKRRTFRVRNKFASKGTKPRISVFRSAKHIYAQIIDDGYRKGTAAGVTLGMVSSLKIKDFKGDKKAMAKHIGLELGKIAIEQSLTDVFFDRGPYKYHGRVRALAEGLRESGLKF